MAASNQRSQVSVEEVGDVRIVTFADKRLLDKQQIDIITRRLLELFDQEKCHRIILDLENIEYISSNMLGGFITLHKRLLTVKRRLVLCNIDPKIREVLEITRLDRHFKCVRDEHDALRQFTQ